MRDSEGGSLGPKVFVSFALVVEVSSRSRVLFHVPFHPIWKLLLVAVPEASPSSRVGFETRINVVAGLSLVLGSVDEPRLFWHTVDVDRFLQSGCALLIKDAIAIVLMVERGELKSVSTSVQTAVVDRLIFIDRVLLVQRWLSLVFNSFLTFLSIVHVTFIV